MTEIRPFPSDWDSALVLVPHPDDPEYGVAAAVAKWTAAGKTVRYALACRGEVGIEGMAPAEAGPLREREQRRSAAVVGVDHVEFWDFPDSNIFNTPELRAKIAEVIGVLAPDVVITLYSGPEWAPGAPNQRDHIEFSNAVAGAVDSHDVPPTWFFECGPRGTHGETVNDRFVELAIEALTAHDVYLTVLDPDTPVPVQARVQIERGTQPHPAFEGQHTVEFILKRSAT